MYRAFFGLAAIVLGFLAGWVAHSRLATVETRRYNVLSRPVQEANVAVFTPHDSRDAEKQKDELTKKQLTDIPTEKKELIPIIEAKATLLSEIQEPQVPNSSEILAADDIRRAIAKLNDLDHPELLNQILMGIDSLPDNAQREELFSYLDKTIENLKQNSPQIQPPLNSQNGAPPAAQEPVLLTYGDIFQSIHVLDPSAADRDDRVMHLITSIQQLPDSQQQDELLNDLARQLQP